jgi:hypothetical protein
LTVKIPVCGIFEVSTAAACNDGWSAFEAHPASAKATAQGKAIRFIFIPL